MWLYIANINKLTLEIHQLDGLVDFNSLQKNVYVNYIKS